MSKKRRQEETPRELAEDDQAVELVAQLLELNQQLLDSISAGDWEMYATLCDPTLSAFEPEARGHLVEGMEFHQFYFELRRSELPYNVTMSAPHVRLLGDNAAVISCIRLLQSVGTDGATKTDAWEETRVWECRDGQWRHVHFHRSANR